MARKRIALSQFSVETESFDGGVALVHSYRQCDWQHWVDGDSPPEITRLAKAHARSCDGLPQPRPPRQERPPGLGFVPAIWTAEIKASLVRQFAESQAHREYRERVESVLGFADRTDDGYPVFEYDREGWQP